ncbi:MAG TPA: exodeoxyribonuclease VII small subunit [Tissierellia bacterium]|nr:exodeoxyribonuclease VII small subunit [Tissierellia bacterium]
MKIEDMSYEDAVEELEKIVEELENDNLSLKDSMEKFKRGIALYNYCNKILSSMEGEVKILLKNDNGILEEEDFSVEV